MHGASALHAAAGNVDVWIRDWLRSRYVMVGIGGRKTTGLPKTERFAVVTALLEAGADPNRLDAQGRSAIGLSSTECARALLEAGADPAQGDALLWAVRCNQTGTVKLLLEAGAGTGKTATLVARIVLTVTPGTGV